MAASVHLEPAEQQTFKRISALFFPEYFQKTVRESSTVQKCMNVYKNNFVLKMGVTLGFLMALPEMSLLGTFGAILAWTAGTSALVFRAHVVPTVKKAAEAFENDITSGVLIDRYEKAMENRDDFEAKMMWMGFEPIHSPGHESLRAGKLQDVFKREAARAAAAAKFAGPASNTAPDAPAA